MTEQEPGYFYTFAFLQSKVRIIYDLSFYHFLSLRVYIHQEEMGRSPKMRTNCPFGVGHRDSIAKHGLCFWLIVYQHSVNAAFPFLDLVLQTFTD